MSVSVCPQICRHIIYCSAHDEWLIMKLCMYVVCIYMRDGAIHYKVYLLKLTMAVDNIVFRIIKGAF